MNNEPQRSVSKNSGVGFLSPIKREYSPRILMKSANVHPQYKEYSLETLLWHSLINDIRYFQLTSHTENKLRNNFYPLECVLSARSLIIILEQKTSV